MRIQSRHRVEILCKQPEPKRENSRKKPEGQALYNRKGFESGKERDRSHPKNALHSTKRMRSCVRYRYNRGRPLLPFRHGRDDQHLPSTGNNKDARLHDDDGEA